MITRRSEFPPCKTTEITRTISVFAHPFPHLRLSTFPHPLSRLPRELNRRLEAIVAKGTSIDE